jgi:maleamate amidohydrolase
MNNSTPPITPPTRFDAAGYGHRDIGFGGAIAILVVDFQVGLTRPEFAMGQSPHIHAAVENTATLLADARARHIPVAACSLAWSSEQAMPYWKIAGAYDSIGVGHPATALDPRIHDPDYDFAFTKPSPSIFFGTPLMPFLIRQRVDTVVVTGCMTSGCVRASVVDSFSHGFRTIVAEECVGDLEIEPHIANLTDIRRRYADVVPLRTVFAALERQGVGTLI